MKRLLMIGCGAMGRHVRTALLADARLEFAYVLERADRCEALQVELGSRVRVVASLDDLHGRPDFTLECAGHAAVATSVAQLLRDGVDVSVASVGALAESGVPERLALAADAGKTQLTSPIRG